MAITWRNINLPIGAGVGALMAGAQRGLASSFDTLQQALAQRNKTEAANWQQQRQNNTADYLDAVQAIQDPTQAADPTVQANLAQMRQQFGYQVDANAVRGALDERVQNLQQQGLQRIEFNDKTRIDSERDTVDQIASLYQAGRYSEGDKLREGQNFRDDNLLDKLRVDSQRGYSQEQRAVNAEGRAVAAAGRAAESHALSQQVGRANLAWTTEQRDRLRNEIRREDTGNTLLNNTISSFEANRAAEVEQVNNIALGYGFEVKDGVPVIPEGTSQEVRNNLAKDLEDAGIGQLKSPTAMRKELESQLRQAGLKPSEINQQMTAFEATVNRGNTLNAADQAELDTQKAAVTTAATTATEVEKKRWTDQQRKNPFLQGIEDPNMTSEDVVKSLKANEFDPVFFEGTNRDQVLKLTTNILSNGLEVDGIKYDVPAPMLKAAMAMGANDWFDPSEGIEDSLKAMIRANPEAYAASIGALDAHKQNLRDINTAAIKQNSRIETQSKAKAGIPYSTEKFLKTLRKERN